MSGMDVREQRDAPPSRGLPLGLRLSLTTSLIVLGVVGSLLLVQEQREAEHEQQARSDLLDESLSPLAAQVEQATTKEEIRNQLKEFQQAYLWRGHTDHQVDLRDAEGRVVASSLPGREAGPRPSSLQAVVKVASPLLPQGSGTLTVWQDDTQAAEELTRRWRMWWLDMGVLLLCILLSLQLAHHLLVARPLNQLLDGVRMLRQGSWRALEVPRGAWELRWLAWQFRMLGEELGETVRRLVEAERRALGKTRLATDGGAAEGSPFPASSPSPSPAPAPGADEGEPPPGTAQLPAAPGGTGGARTARGKSTLVHEFLRQYLRDRSRLLESLDPRSPEARATAREVWDRDAIEAERLGDVQLKARLEDAALRVLDPPTFARVAGQLQAFLDAREGWTRDRLDELRRALERQGVPHLSISHRVKHLAGVWRKMQAKELGLEQVFDLFAFRVVVPEEQDCYLALRAIHEEFDAQLLLFKDYIAEPKPSGYQSLHTYVQSRQEADAPARPVFEVQIRSARMHRHAEADHWRYKRETGRQAPPGPLRASLRRLGAAVGWR